MSPFSPFICSCNIALRIASTLAAKAVAGGGSDDRC